MDKVKSFFKKVGLWFKNHAPSKRRLIQIYAALLFNANLKGFFSGGNNVIYRGNTKYFCSPGLNCYSCPGAVAACPLGALQNAMASTDKRAPYYVLGILALFGLMLGRTICGFLCPVGLGQELLHKIKTPKLKKSRYTRILSYFKYVLLVVCVIAIPVIYQGIPAFCKYICPAGTFGGAGGLLANPNNSDFFNMLGYLFSWKFILLVVFIVGSIFVYRFFCRFFCPLGAIYGFFNKIALLGVKLDNQKCIDCGLCVQTCQMDIRHVGDHECINCGLCIPVCPTKAISWKGSKIFLHSSVIESLSEEHTENVSIAAIAARGSANANAVVGNQNASNANAVADVQNSVSVKEVSSVSVGADGEIAATDEGMIAEDRETRLKEAQEKLKKRSFWLQFGAWVLALAVLIFALVYYNFLAPTNVATVYGKGDKCPDFTIDVYNTAGTRDADGEVYSKFSTNVAADGTITSKGTVTVINFWYTTCDPCVAELPYFAEVKEEFGDEILMVAVHAANGEPKVQEFIDSVDEAHNKVSWSEWGIIFAQDTAELDCYTMLGGKGAYPMTVIVNADGVITFVQQGSTSEDLLRSEIQSALGK